MARYGLTDFERRVVQTLLPNKPRGGPSPDGRGKTRRVNQKCSCSKVHPIFAQQIATNKKAAREDRFLVYARVKPFRRGSNRP